jgi:hypothetical protein
VEHLAHRGTDVAQLVVAPRRRAFLGQPERELGDLLGLVADPLEVTVYTGKDAMYELWDDDGETTDWSTSPATASSLLALTWTEATQCLTWALNGSYVGPRSFLQLSVTAYVAGAAPKTAPAQAIGKSGSACPV